MTILHKSIIVVTLMIASFKVCAESGRCYKTYDPFESFNRGTFNFNEGLDRAFLKPVVKVYYYFVPKWGQSRVASFFHNLTEPLSFINYIFQGKTKEASQSAWRFVVNTTFGLGGMFDPATKAGLVVKQKTFRDTMAHYKMNYGAYIVVPIFGPATTRDAYGMVIDVFSDPIGIAIAQKSYHLADWYSLVITGYDRIKADAVLQTVDESSLDRYSKIRDLYIQSLSAADPNCEQDENTMSYENVE